MTDQAGTITGQDYLWNMPGAKVSQYGIAPKQPTFDPNILNSMQAFQDAAYKNQTSRLDPFWQQQQTGIADKLSAQGIMPGSEAYNNAMQSFNQGRNDAYSQASNNALQAGLGAQNQAYQQWFGPEQLNNAYRIAQVGAAGQGQAAQIAANASMHNNDANNATNQLLGLGNLGLGYNQQQMQGNQNDFNNMLAMLGYGNSVDQYNNQLVGNAQNYLLGNVPNQGPTPVDVTGAYGMNQAGQNAQYQGQVAGANGTNAMIGTVGTALIMML